MAGLLRLGLAPLTALRLTSWAAAAASVGLVWGVLRFALKDRVGGFVGGLVLLSAWSYVGEHGARTGDYDALESLFILSGVLCVWRAAEFEAPAWLLPAGLALALGVLTKGVAALLPGPGLALYVLYRPGRLGRLLKDGRTWAAAALFLGLAGGYYLLRERIDPGYLRAVAGNELGGRFMKVTENHHGSWHFYLTKLLLYAEPCTFLCALGVMPLFGRVPARRSLVLAAGLAAGSLLLVLSASQSKMAWYVTPMIPLMALVAGLGTSDALQGLTWRRSRAGAPLRLALAAILAFGASASVWQNQTDPARTFGELGGTRFGYGALLEAVRTKGLARRVVVLDGGFRNDAGFANYDPMLKFWADWEGARGLTVEVAHGTGALRPGQQVASCDAALQDRLDRAFLARGTYAAGGCSLAALLAPRR